MCTDGWWVWAIPLVALILRAYEGAVQLPPIGECPLAPVQICKSENVMFMVLQEANFVQVTG